MKINACDLCLADRKMVTAGWVYKVKQGPQSMRVDICAAHRGALKGKTYDAVLDIVVKAEQKYNELTKGGF